MTMFTDVYPDVGRKASSYSLSCLRIRDGRGTQRDRERLVELGNRILEALKVGYRFDDKNDERCFVGSFQGCLLAIAVEEEYLKVEERCTEGLRRLGVTSLEELARVLMEAENKDEFDKYASHLTKLFREWHDFAEECYTLHRPPVHCPTTMGSLVAKVMNRQN